MILMKRMVNYIAYIFYNQCLLLIYSTIRYVTGMKANDDKDGDVEELPQKRDTTDSSVSYLC